MSVNFIPAEVINTHWEAVERGAHESGRTPNRSQWRVARDVYVAETTEEARHEALNGILNRDYQDYLMKSMGHTNRLSLFKRDPNMPDSDLTPEYFLENIWIVGSPLDVADQLRELHKETGGFGVLLAMGHEWNPKAKWMKSMELLSREVMPRLADLK